MVLRIALRVIRLGDRIVNVKRKPFIWGSTALPHGTSPAPPLHPVPPHEELIRYGPVQYAGRLYPPPPCLVNRQSESITFLQTTYAGGKYRVQKGHEYVLFLQPIDETRVHPILVSRSEGAADLTGFINPGFSTGRIQCEVLTTLPILSSWIKKFLGQQSKIWVDNSVEKLFR